MAGAPASRGGRPAYHARMARRAQHLRCYVREANERTTGWISARPKGCRFAAAGPNNVRQGRATARLPQISDSELTLLFIALYHIINLDLLANQSPSRAPRAHARLPEMTEKGLLKRARDGLFMI